MRTVAGPTYYCRTGKSFKGHVKEKFLLVDCAVVMSGSYRCAAPALPPGLLLEPAQPGCPSCISADLTPQAQAAEPRPSRWPRPSR